LCSTVLCNKQNSLLLTRRELEDPFLLVFLTTTAKGLNWRPCWW